MNNLRENEDAEYVFKEYNVHPLRTDPVNDQILFGQSTNFTIQDLSEEGTINFTYDMVTSVCGFHYMLPMRCIRPYFLTYLTTYEKMNTALEGGFHSNGVYEINGPTLSGKTTLVNNIIDSNKKSKILFIDTLGTNLFIEYDEDLNQPKEEDHKHVTHVTDIRKLNDLIVYLNELKVHYDIIIIDKKKMNEPCGEIRRAFLMPRRRCDTCRENRKGPVHFQAVLTLLTNSIVNSTRKYRTNATTNMNAELM